MKKALIVLLLLALVAGGLFAQITFGGNVQSGLMVASEDDTTFHVYNPGVGTRYRFELNGNFTNASGKAGANFRFQGRGEPLFDNFAHVWVKPLDTLWLYAGRVDANRWETPGAMGQNGGVGGPVGLHIRFDPISGLSLGVGVAPNGGEIGDASYRFGASYTATGLLTAIANINYDGAGNEGDGQTNAAAGVNILALSGLGLSRLGIDASVTNLSKLDTLGTFGFGPRIEFAVGAFSSELRVQVYVPVVENQELDLAGHVRGTYKINDTVSARLGVGYSMAAALASTNGATFDYRWWDGLPGKSISAEETSVVTAQPALIFSIGGGTLEAGYGLLTQLSGDSLTKHGIYATFNVGF